MRAAAAAEVQRELLLYLVKTLEAKKERRSGRREKAASADHFGIIVNKYMNPSRFLGR